jgi:hypothetical protein
MADTVKEVAQQMCPNCGCERTGWPTPNGYDGMHCCEPCAHGQPCSCGSAERIDMKKDDRAID